MEKQMDRNEVYKFLKLYIRFMRQVPARVEIVKIDSATEEVEIRIWNEMGEIANHFRTDLWHAAEILSANSI